MTKTNGAKKKFLLFAQKCGYTSWKPKNKNITKEQDYIGSFQFIFRLFIIHAERGNTRTNNKQTKNTKKNETTEDEKKNSI